MCLKASEVQGHRVTKCTGGKCGCKGSAGTVKDVNDMEGMKWEQFITRSSNTSHCIGLHSTAKAVASILLSPKMH